MADLGSKKIGSNYHKLLQIDGTVQDGSGSNASIIMGAGKHISGSATTTGSFGRVETQTISASSGQFDAGTVYVGNVAMSENSAGGVTFSDGNNRELGALQGNGYFILSCSTAVNSARPLFNMTQQVGTVQNKNLAQIKMSTIAFYIDGGNKQWMYGAQPSGSNYQGDFFLNDNFTSNPDPSTAVAELRAPAFYITASNKYWGIGTYPNSTNMVRISGSLFVEGPVGNITASGNISGSVTSTGSFGRLDIGGAGATQADIVIKGTQPELSVVSTNSATDPQIQLTNTPNGIDWSIGADASDSDKFKIDAGWYPGQNTKLTIVSASGNIGVGTRIPGQKLTVVGNISASGDIYGDNIYGSGNIFLTANTPRVDFGDNDYIYKTPTDTGIFRNSTKIVGVADTQVSINKNLIVSGGLYLTQSNAVYHNNTKRLTLGSTNTFVGNVSASGDLYVGGNDIYGINGTNGVVVKRISLGKTSGFNMNGVTIEGDIAIPSGEISASGHISTSKNIKANKGNFTNLPTNPNATGVLTGDLYTLSGSQLPFATGSAGSAVRELWNQYSASKFVLIK
tara:strand:+ start:8564 stop:10264 length:1701 start_codon:yes stop_codon:yes gene_type:complete